MYTPFKINSTLGPTYILDLSDVLRTKVTLQSLGYYKPSPLGLTKYPDGELFDAIQRFQADNGLYKDGIIRPGGKTEQALRARASEVTPLPTTGRERGTALGRMPQGDPVPFRKSRTFGSRAGNGEGFDDEGKTGTYIWRTKGDGKVRSAHAGRDGKVFSWSSPPEGGHPGDAHNCRCSAEDVEDCEEIKWKAGAAWKRHDTLQNPIHAAERDVDVTSDLLDELKTRRASVLEKLASAAIPDRPGNIKSRGGVISVLLTAEETRRLLEDLGRLDRETASNSRALERQKEALAQLDRERNDHRLNAEALENKYKECTERQR